MVIGHQINILADICESTIAAFFDSSRKVIINIYIFNSVTKKFWIFCKKYVKTHLLEAGARNPCLVKKANMIKAQKSFKWGKRQLYNAVLWLFLNLIQSYFQGKYIATPSV